MSDIVDRRYWKRNQYFINDTVVGSLERTNTGSWYAYGCIEEWEYFYIGYFTGEDAAKAAVENWVDQQI